MIIYRMVRRECGWSHTWAVDRKVWFWWFQQASFRHKEDAWQFLLDVSRPITMTVPR